MTWRDILREWWLSVSHSGSDGVTVWMNAIRPIRRLDMHVRCYEHTFMALVFPRDQPFRLTRIRFWLPDFNSYIGSILIGSLSHSNWRERLIIDKVAPYGAAATGSPRQDKFDH